MYEEDKPKKRKKCRATGKVSFPSRVEAYAAMVVLRWRSKHPRKRSDGTRVKRRMKKKPAIRRLYYCEYCTGYHLTTLTKGQYEESKRNSWR